MQPVPETCLLLLALIVIINYMKFCACTIFVSFSYSVFHPIRNFSHLLYLSPELWSPFSDLKVKLIDIIKRTLYIIAWGKIYLVNISNLGQQENENLFIISTDGLTVFAVSSLSFNYFFISAILSKYCFEDCCSTLFSLGLPKASLSALEMLSPCLFSGVNVSV